MKLSTGTIAGLLIIAAVFLYTTAKEKSATRNAQGQPVAGAGVDPYQCGPYSTEALAVAGGLII
jgi:hypothetical protein